MKGIDFEVEELLVTVSVGLAFHGFDFIVGAFQRAAGYGVIVIVQEAGMIGAKRLGECDQLADFRGFGAFDPLKQERLGLIIILLLRMALSCRKLF
jgi:hypothetical protein